MKPSYWDYLQLDRLLSLQSGLEPSDDGMLVDELHFIVVHQSYELWFKLVLRCLRAARDALAAPKVAEEAVPLVVQQLRRVNSIFGLLVQQFEVMETMTPQGFLDFRDKLVPASGFQSFQMREIEIITGLLDAERIRYGNIDPVQHIDESGRGTDAGEFARQALARARAERTVLSCLDDWLFRTPIQGSSPSDPGDEAVVSQFIDEYLAKLTESHRAQLARLVAALQVQEEAALASRFDALKAEAKRFLSADDTPEPERARRRRIRAAVLFIESYRELPLLSWPRLLLDAVVEMEEGLVLFRHRHARMVERMIT